MSRRSNGFRRLAAIVKQQCPRCLQGQVFATLFQMHAQCPICGIPFEREPGYFTGAMYLSYGMAIIATASMWLLLTWLGRSLKEVLLVIGPLLIGGSPGPAVMRACYGCTSTKQLIPCSSKRATRRRAGIGEARRSHRTAVAGMLIGMGGFVDSIVFHQIAQWHNMLSTVISPQTMEDGLFHALTWIITLVGIVWLRSAAYARVATPSLLAFTGQLIPG